jgi:hypothetical protein
MKREDQRYPNGGQTMKDKRSLHLKVQELADCFATTDTLGEMSKIKDDADKDEAALKWLALAALHGVNANSEKISLMTSGSDKVQVNAEYRRSELPSPGAEIGRKILEALKEITHLEGEDGRTSLVLGIRDSSLEVRVKLKRSKDGEKLTLKFPG